LITSRAISAAPAPLDTRGAGRHTLGMARDNRIGYPDPTAWRSTLATFAVCIPALLVIY